MLVYQNISTSIISSSLLALLPCNQIMFFASSLPPKLHPYNHLLLNYSGVRILAESR